jgi:prepilin-type processing-associated H-X9-DG protein
VIPANAFSTGVPPISFTISGLAPSDYSPVAGIYSGSAGSPTGYANIAYAGFSGQHWGDGVMHEYCGPLTGNQPVAVAEILDGTSNTMTIGERVGGPSLYVAGNKIIASAPTPPGYGNATGSATDQAYVGLNGGGWGDLVGTDNWIAGSPSDGGDPGALFFANLGGPCAINCTNGRDIGMYSMHPGGMNVVMADASVHFISENVDPFVFASMITKSNQEVYTAPW